MFLGLNVLICYPVIYSLIGLSLYNISQQSFPYKIVILNFNVTVMEESFFKLEI